jgi:hypothetical protein
VVKEKLFTKMSRKKIVAGNWKMNLVAEEAITWPAKKWVCQQPTWWWTMVKFQSKATVHRRSRMRN